FVDLKNTEGNSGNDVIALGDTSPAQLATNGGRVRIDYVNPAVICELSFQIAGKRRIKFKQKQLRIRPHSLRQLSGVSAFARPIFGDDLSALEINFVCYSLDQHFRARHNRSNLERPFQKLFEKQNAH